MLSKYYFCQIFLVFKMDNIINNQKEVTKSNSIDFFNMNHEKILFCQDEKSGLKAIIAVHNTVCGPALGGTRMWNYLNNEQALIDVMRLSRGMTYKNAISGLNLGGGKAVIIGDSKTGKSPELFMKFGEFVESFSGSYITAEDVGISPKDMLHVSKTTQNVTGLPGKKGDPSPITAYGVYMGMKAALKFQSGKESLLGKKILIQGVGHVGLYLVDYLYNEGAEIIISDINKDAVTKTVKKYNCSYVKPKDLFNLNVDIYAPCALGATINNSTINELKCSIVAGAANNQLQDDKIHGQQLFDKGIIYAPDYLINAGGVMNCYAEIHGISDEKVMQMAGNIYNTTLDILNKSRNENIPSSLAANIIAEDRIKKESLKLKNAE